MNERLQKIMAQAGIGSRRQCETFIVEGRVSVNGTTAVLGEKADPEVDRIVLDGMEIARPATKIYIALHKPRGVLSTVEAPDPRPTVRDMVPVQGSIYPVGRLDVESEGLILLTNDGDLANQLTHPRYGHEKEYRVLVAKQPDPEQLAAWRYGVILEDGYKTAPAEVEVDTIAGKGAWLRVILQEGRKRQLREMGMRTGLPVIRIVSIRIGTLQLGRLRPSEWRYLTPREVTDLRKRPASRKSRQNFHRSESGPLQSEKQNRFNRSTHNNTPKAQTSAQTGAMRSEEDRPTQHGNRKRPFSSTKPQSNGSMHRQIDRSARRNTSAQNTQRPASSTRKRPKPQRGS